jgi:hypothetical protein
MKLTAAQRKARNTKRYAVAVFLTGAAVSVTANFIAAEPTALGRAVSVWPALALLVTVHLYQAVPVTRNGWLGAAYKLSVLAVIGVAAWVSYWHIVEVTLRAGESQLTAYIMPATIDAMMAIASAVATHKPKPAARRKPLARKASGTVRHLRSTG